MLRPQYKLHRCPSSTAEGKYSASVVNPETMDTDQVVEEAISYSGITLSPYIFESVAKGLLESMINNTLQDGRPRRFGDYFQIQLDLKGSFDDKDAQFDPERQRMKLTLRPLKRFRARIKTGTPENVLKPPRAYIDMVRSETAGENELRPGEDIIITGRNLELLGTSYGIFFSYINAEGLQAGSTLPVVAVKENTPTRIVVEYGKVFGTEGISDTCRTVNVSIASEGGKEGGQIRTVKYKDDVTVLPDRADGQ